MKTCLLMCALLALTACAAHPAHCSRFTPINRRVAHPDFAVDARRIAAHGNGGGAHDR